MVWTIKRIEADNFMGFRHLDLDLSKYRGLTSIEGSRASPGTSNGASKSTIFEAIKWCLDGKLMRKQRKADKVIHRWAPPTERTLVRLTIDVDGRQVIAERSRTRSGSASLRLFNEGKPSTVAGVQDVLNRTLGLLDDRTLTSTAIFSGAMAQFCQLTDGERKAALERMVGADHFAAASKLALEKEKEAADRKTIAEQRVMSIDGEVDSLLAERGRAAAQALELAIVDALELKNLRRRAIQCSVEADRTSDLLREHYEVANAAATEADLVRAKLRAEVASAQKSIDLADAGINECDRLLAVTQSRVNQLRKEKSDIETGKHPDTCPHCQQRWPQAGLSANSLDKALKRLDADILSARTGTAPVEAKKAVHQQERAAAVKEKNHANAEIEELNTLTDTRTERRLLTDAITAENQLAAAHKAVLEFMESQPDPEFAELTIDLTAEDARVDAAKARREKAASEAQKAGDEARRFAFWKKGFGRAGLPSYLLDSSVPAMNQVVGKLAAALSNGELIVSFNPAAAKGSNDLFAVDVEYADGSDDYDMSSTGEHTRVDLAVMFTLRDIVERRGANRCSQLFLDEVFMGTDPAFADAIMGMLRNYYGDRDVFIISHDDAIKSLCDSTITVKKVGREATIA